MNLLPRPFWWTLYVLTLVDFFWNTWAFFFDHDHWHLEAILTNVLCLVMTSHRLAFPPKPSRDRT